MDLCAVTVATEPESQLVEACRAGDRDAFRRLFELYRDKVYSLAMYHFGGDESAARDAAQQAFVKLFTALPSFHGDCAFATWLYRIVWNCCLDQRRGNRAWKALDELPREPRQTGSHEESYARRQLAGAIRTAVHSLKPDLRWPILLRYFDDLSYREIGSILHCSEGTVASRLSRGHRMLAGKLAHLRQRT
jgi:RNA polymerase sigma-70 factor (ECF subfamily)